MLRICNYVGLAVVVLLTGFCESAHAADANVGLSKKEPVLLRAREMGYDEPNATATAIGNVEIVQGSTILLADRVTYNQNTDTVHATGHVSVLEPGGDVLFSDEAILRDQMQKGVVQQFRARLQDNSLFAAREARKISKNVTKLKDAVYSPCNVCVPKDGEKAEAPLWQMKAETVTIDENAQRVRYHDAYMEVYGVPVAYTPYFSHPTPDAPSQSGLLQPQYFHATDLGNVIKEPIFLSIAPNMDATITPWYLSGERPLVEGEFRHLTQDGYYELRGAVTDTYNRDAAGDIIPGNKVRGYVQAHGKLQLDKYWDAGIDAERTTDNTFLQLYHFNWQDMLTSRLYAERIRDRDYAVVESLAFQGLQPQDQASQSPYILPQASMHVESAQMAAHSHMEFDANALVLTRQQGDNDQRLSSTVGWKLPYITHNGQVFEMLASLRGDAYNVNNQITNTTTGMTESGDTGRLIPQIELDWRYPFVNRFGEGRSLTIAPIIEVAASPNLHSPALIPNEDSQIAELSDINLFSANRFTGLDQVESGLRGTYGMRGQLQFADQKYLEWLLGQAYQENQDSPFPLANSAQARFSDYIGRVAMKYKWIDLAYSFRIDRQTLAPTSNEITTDFLFKPISFSATYISLKNEPLFGDRKEVFGSAALDLADHWTWTAGGRKDLGSDEATPTTSSLPPSAFNPLLPSQGTVGLYTGLIFHNECMMVSTNLGRSYINQQDVRPSTTVSVTLVLKNFGTPGTGAGTGGTTGAGNLTGVSDGQNPVSGNNYSGYGSGH